MDYGHPELADRLAAEYALGTLRGAARRRFETLLPAHPALRRATGAWERRLSQLSVSVPAVRPSPAVWAGVEHRLFGGPERADDSPIPAARGASAGWRSLGLWQGALALSTVAIVALTVRLSQPLPIQPPRVIVMAAQPGATGGGSAASFVASVAGDGRSLILTPLGDRPPQALDTALELWAVPASGAPRSLGVVSSGRETTVIRASLLEGTAAFAVTVEPPGGSPSGAPTGPIISVGKLQL